MSVKLKATKLKVTVATLALLGALTGTGALAEMGQRGPGGPDGRGAMLLEMFDGIDTDSDGKLTEAELEAHRTAMFTAFDANGDGLLDAEELAARQLARFSETLAERTARMIENRDNNGDGSLSLAEMDAGPGQRGFARIDTDNDGAISKAEAQEAGERMGKRMGEQRKHRKGAMWGWND
ncbi:EF-hand domain-containing protein [Tabrizicola sp.]|uniref:EF-hand domain-containing protein n=1 Tax=Tabrizicola sp. TaxID=2005166 RepID=UPI0026265631|nr:EF-hand domain-containing protein [Tabrizicola sp.]MDM7933397.1 EF-hand domain-containing protein [Tabrizicola sp.]